MAERVIALTVPAGQAEVIPRLREVLQREFPGVLLGQEETVEEALQAVHDGCHHICNKLDFDPLVSAYRQLLDRASGEVAERLGKLTERFARMAAQLKVMMRQTHEWLARPVPRKAPVDLAAVIREAIGGASFAVVFDIAPAGEFPVDLDRDQFARALDELARNSHKHHPRPDELSIQVELVGFEHEGRPWARIDFRDNGGGIPEQLKERIFEPFFHRSLNGEWGTGCGLFHVRRVVRAHGGSITEVGAPGDGALFRIQLPRGPAPRGAEGTTDARG